MYDYDYIVIGGGICGLQIAALCSKLGKVLVVEKQSRVGGRARVVEKDGFLLDWGPHPVRYGPNSALAQTAEECGLHVEFIDPGLSYVYMEDGTRHVFPSGLKGYVKTKMIPRLNAIKTLVKLYRKVKKDAREMYETSISDFFNEENVDPRVRIFFKIGSASMQVNPFMDRSSIGELMKNTVQVIKKKSVFYPKGGWSTFFDGFQQCIDKNDGLIKLDTKVDQIVVESGRATGIKTDEGVITGRHIISTIPVQYLFDLLDPNYAPDDFVEKCKNLRPTAGICIDFCLNRQITDETLVFFEDPPSFGLVSSNLSREVAPENCSIMSFFMPTDVSVVKDESKRTNAHQRFRKRIIDTYPGIEENLVFERPLFLEMVDGVEIAVDQHRLNRPMPEDLDLSGLYLTGDSIGGEGAGGDVGHTSVRECFKKIRSESKE